MRKILLQLALMTPLFFPLPNQAGLAHGASLTGATMTWYGVYTVASSTTASPTKNVSTGITPPAANSDHVKLGNDTIKIGYGYRLIGSPPAAQVTLIYRTIFPNGRYQDNSYDGLAINREDLFIGQLLDHDSETGTYVLQVWHDNRTLLEKSFTVSKP